MDEAANMLKKLDSTEQKNIENSKRRGRILYEGQSIGGKAEQRDRAYGVFEHLGEGSESSLNTVQREVDRGVLEHWGRLHKQ